jgi:hypothetical protein
MAADGVSPWVKVGPVIFRSSHVDHDGSTINVKARIRNPDVLAALEAMRPDGMWGRSGDSVVTWAGRTVPVTIESVQTETTAGRGARVTLVARQLDRHLGTSMTDVSMGERTPEDLTQLALRVALFGEPNPLGSMSFMAELDNPFEALKGVRLPADAVEPVAALLFTEAFVGSGRADRITNLQIGPPHRGRRRFAMEWVPRPRYSNVTPERRGIEGDVAIPND